MAKGGEKEVQGHFRETGDFKTNFKKFPPRDEKSEHLCTYIIVPLLDEFVNSSGLVMAY